MRSYSGACQWRAAGLWTARRDPAQDRPASCSIPRCRGRGWQSQGRQRHDRRRPAMITAEEDPRRTIRKLNLIGLVIVAVLIGGVGGWAATTQLAGAVIAPGTIVVESNIKKVQHASGGVVGEILVKGGSEVKDGDVVLRLGTTVTGSAHA